MKSDPLGGLFDEYKRIAREHIAKTEHLAPHTLTGHEADQLTRWLALYHGNRVLEEGQTLNLEELAGWLGFGIWHVDHLSEWISYLFVDSNYKPVSQKIEDLARKGQPIRRRIRIPLRQGTTGYVVEKAASLYKPFYLIHDCEGDLRGTVAIEDRWLGELNAILVPVVSLRQERHRVHAVFCLFHPMPDFFTSEFAEQFFVAIQSLGRDWIQALQRPTARPAATPDARGLDKQLHEQITTRIAHDTTDAATADGVEATRFPWVGLLGCGPDEPVGPAPAGWSPLETWVEPDSFIRSRQERTIDSRIRAVKYDGRLPLQVDASGEICFLTKCDWSDDVCDLVLTLPAGDALCGFVRVHLSAHLLSDDFDRQLEVVRRLEPDFRNLGAAIVELRAAYRQNLRDKKVEREWERTLFEQFFRELFTVDSANPVSQLKEFIEVSLKVLRERTTQTSENATHDRIVRIVCALAGKLREFNLREACLVGASYCSCGEEMLLAGPPPAELNDSHLLRDLQLALTLLVTTGDRRSRKVVATWPHGGVDGRVEVDGVTCYLHLELTSKGSRGRPQWFDTMTINPASGAHYDIVFSRTDGPVSELRTRWYLHPKAPMVRAWHIRESVNGLGAGPLAEHLDHCHQVRAQQMAPVLEALQQWWDPRDGLVDQATPFDILPGEAPEPGCIWTDASGRAERTALRTLLLHLAADEIRDLSQIWALPVKALDHVYYWVLVGVRHKPSEGEKDLFQVVLDQVQASVGNIAAEVERETLQRVFLLEFERRDAWHQLKIPLEGVKSALRAAKEGKDCALLDQAHKHLRAVEDWFLLWAQNVNEGYNARDGNSLREILITALGLAKRRNPDQEADVRGCLKPAIDGLGEVVLEQRFRLGRQEKYGLLVVLCTDLLLNAAKHSGFRKVMISWDPTAKALTVRNPIPEGKTLVLSKAIPMLNRALRVSEFEKEWQTLKEATFAVDEQGAGLLNIFSAACRLRLGINFRIEPEGDSGWCVATVFLRRFLTIPREELTHAWPPPISRDR